MIALLLAAQLSLPTVLHLPYNDVRAVFSGGDMPADVAAVGISRFVFTRTTVGPDGKARDCTVERNSGDARLGVYTCAVIMDRARFEAAKWVDGSSVYGVIRAPITYAIDSWPSESEQLRAYPPDMALSVNRLSAGAGARVKVNLAIAADENGRVVGCIERPPFSSHAPDKHFPELIDIACQQVTSKFTALIAKDKSGKPVRSIQNVTVLFSSGE